uniref:Uncharacterized protein n=1 Tax=Ralstonia solanacearum TaxID=305 RepID=A0A0S4UVX5_RALSL|nr:protein of unknown function [Ralstonia solanacearum]CUV36738.1 protein of unknown function [Ralstonia solanacearum]CUV41950.1 protein of unknown function [Ralstonia solanacearum]CUV62987.1 protein of unknown function [Ralstonia solanacearum]
MLVGGIVVDDKVHIKIVGHRTVDVIQKGDEFLMPVTRLALRNHFAGGGIERCKQRCCAMANVIVRDALDVTKPHRQQRLRTLQCLALALLIDTQHKCVGRRAQVQPDDVADLLDEERVVGQLEAFCPMGLHTEQGEIAGNGALRYARLLCRCTHTPMRRTSRRFTQNLAEQLRNSLIVMRARAARFRLIVQPCQALRDESPFPMRHRWRSDRALSSDFGIRMTIRCHEDNLRATHQRMWERTRSAHRHKLLSFAGRYFHGNTGSSHGRSSNNLEHTTSLIS